MKKKFMYICLTTGLFSSGILVNNLNAGNYTAEQFSEPRITLGQIKKELTLKNWENAYYSYTNCKKMSEYYKNLTIFIYKTVLPLLNYKINNNSLGNIITNELNNANTDSPINKTAFKTLQDIFGKKNVYHYIYKNDPIGIPNSFLNLHPLPLSCFNAQLSKNLSFNFNVQMNNDCTTLFLIIEFIDEGKTINLNKKEHKQ